MVGNKGKSSVIIILFAALLALLCAFAVLAAPQRARAEEAASNKAELTPVTVANAQTVYHYFDAPLYAHADGAGILVCGEYSTETISGETEVTATRSIPANKIYRHLEHGDHAEYAIALYNGVISVYGTEQKTAELAADGATVVGIKDFTVYNDTLYAVTATDIIAAPLGASEFVADDVTRTRLVSDRHSRIAANAITANNGIVYVSVASVFGSRSDVCSVKNGVLTTVLAQTESVIALSSYGEYIYALTRSELNAYTASAAGGLVLTHRINGSRFISIHAYNGYVYALDTLNALHKLSDDLVSDNVLLASSGDAPGFFDLPTGVALKNSRLYVADSMNGKIAVFGTDLDFARTEADFVNPVSVASDSAGNVYVAHEYNKISVFPAGLAAQQPTRVISAPELGIIKQIAVNADKTLYILADSGLWIARATDEAPVKVSGEAYKAVTLSAGRDGLYALSDSDILQIDIDENNVASTTRFCSTDGEGVALAADLNGTVFVLTETKIVRYKKNGASADITKYELFADGERYALGGKSGAIALSVVQNGYVSHGDVIIADTYKHRIFKVDGKALDVKLVDGSYNVPDVAGDTTPAFYGTGLIRTTLRDTEVFSLPMETLPAYTITKGRRVIVPHYELEETHEYALILVDDTSTGKLLQGYVYKDALSEPLPYSAPPSDYGTVFNAATQVYKYPSRSAQPVDGYSAVDRNTEFELLDFVEAYRDDYGYMWYRVLLGGNCEGYILGINLSLMSYEPLFIRPAYDAEIISYKNSTFATAYIKDADGKLVPIAELATGTQLEVVGTFDSSEPYTQVKYLDADLGTMTCYVETVYVKYKGVNIVLIVAIIVIVITVILATIIIARTMHNKKRKVNNID